MTSRRLPRNECYDEVAVIEFSLETTARDAISVYRKMCTNSTFMLLLFLQLMRN